MTTDLVTYLSFDGPLAIDRDRGIWLLLRDANLGSRCFYWRCLR